ncbi:MAG TPA: iron-containing alcohol dehydrogenase [Methanocella sp.]|nr:iron-containing alcohol dehydrogenase [Methanocella sp.]
MAIPDSSLIKLRKFVCPEIVFGEEALMLAGQYAKNFGGDRVLAVSGRNVIRAGWSGKVIDSLEDEGLSYSLYSDFTSNPKAEEVMRGAEVYNREGCDVIVAVGGGSAIDCAKGIGIVSANKKHILEFKGVDQIPRPGPPLICVPTTCSGADVSQFAIITDTRRKMKMAIVSKTLVPDTSLIDPATNLTMSSDETEDTDTDALIQAIEAYTSKASSPITDQFALNAIDLVFYNLPKIVKEPAVLDYREKMKLGSLESGLAFTNASLGLIHAMSHSVGGFTDAPHGLCNAILFPYGVKFNYDTIPKRYDKIGEAMGLDLKGLSQEKRKTAIIDLIWKFLDDMGQRRTLEDVGVDKRDIPRLARNAMDDVCMMTNPRSATLEDVIAIYEEAL